MLNVSRTLSDCGGLFKVLFIFCVSFSSCLSWFSAYGDNVLFQGNGTQIHLFQEEQEGVARMRITVLVASMWNKTRFYGDDRANGAPAPEC